MEISTLEQGTAGGAGGAVAQLPSVVGPAADLGVASGMVGGGSGDLLADGASVGVRIHRGNVCAQRRSWVASMAVWGGVALAAVVTGGRIGVFWGGYAVDGERIGQAAYREKVLRATPWVSAVVLGRLGPGQSMLSVWRDALGWVA